MSRLHGINAVLELVFPNRCIYCGKVFPNEKLCPQCKKKMPWAPVGPWETGLSSLPVIYPAVFYLDGVPNAIGRFKFRGQYPLAKHFTALLVSRQGEYLSAVKADAVAAVPMYPKKKRQRGYNQAQLLADELARQLGVPFLPLLKKVKNNKIQHTLGMAQRIGNVQGAYQADAALCRGKRVLLVDDIFTTGATMAECARTLLNAGAEQVLGTVIALVPNTREELPLPKANSDNCLPKATTKAGGSL